MQTSSSGRSRAIGCPREGKSPEGRTGRSPRHGAAAGARRGVALKPVDYPTAESVERAWRDVERNVRDFLAELKDEDLARPVEFSLGGGPASVMALGQLMHHAANHGVHHRGQVALLLRCLGHTPGNVDLLLYYSRNEASTSRTATR